MKIETIKQLNITGLFGESLNHNSVSIQELVKQFSTGNDEDDKHTAIEAPGLKVLAFPNRQLDYVFESQRMLANDKSGKDIKESPVIDDFFVLLKDYADMSELEAYGFNYDVIATQDSTIDFDSLIGEPIKKVVDGLIETTGVKVNYSKNNLAYELQVSPVNPKKVVVHLNVHFSEGDLPEQEELKGLFDKHYSDFKIIVGQL
jgi:hypothetical protein